MADNMKLAVAIAIPNLASMAGCAAAGKCCLTDCLKADASTHNKCPIPAGAWHAALAAANCSVGYASYMIYKDLGGRLGGHEHGAIGVLLLTNMAHPSLIKHCEQYGCGPAMVNSLLGLGAAGLGMYFFHHVNKTATAFLLPGVALALMRFACTMSCCGKLCCAGGPCGPAGSCGTGGSCGTKAK